jgi:hypothetical protein
MVSNFPQFKYLCDVDGGFAAILHSVNGNSARLGIQTEVEYEEKQQLWEPEVEYLS